MGANTTHAKMRIWHRYLGFFLAGIMAVYAISGIVMIFRNTNFLKRETLVKKNLSPHLTPDSLAKALRLRDLKITAQQGDRILFKQGSYNVNTGFASYTVSSLPAAIEKLTRLHKASNQHPLFWLNVFFGFSLLFFVISSFWMFLPKTTIFRKGLYFTLAGLVLTLVLLWT
jgi:uncharacterized iron-regulated membrane protein